MATTAQDTVRLTHTIREWLASLDFKAEARASIAVDLADVLAAARSAERCVEELLSLDPSKPDQADRAVKVAADVEVQLFTELKTHLESLRRSWPAVLERLAERSPADTDD
jgi:hypothetical protein